jgi:hypothetical protein
VVRIIYRRQSPEGPGELIEREGERERERERESLPEIALAKGEKKRTAKDTNEKRFQSIGGFGFRGSTTQAFPQSCGLCARYVCNLTVTACIYQPQEPGAENME